MKLLDDLMAKLPGLPWHTHPDGYAADADNEGVFTCFDLSPQRGQATFDYLLLSANHLPAAVEAMEKAADMMMSAGFYVAGAAMNEALHDYERKIRAVLSAIEADLKEPTP